MRGFVGGVQVGRGGSGRWIAEPGLYSKPSAGRGGHPAAVRSRRQGLLFQLCLDPQGPILMSETTNNSALFVRHPQWQEVSDMDGNQAVDTRRKLLDVAAAEWTRVAFYHAPFPATGYIARSGTGYEFVPVQ
jgi:hypothetical protein